MDTKEPARGASSLADPEYLETLKRDYIDSALSLAESFVRQVTYHSERGEEQPTKSARDNVERFCQESSDMIRMLQDGNSAAAFTARLRILGCRVEAAARFVA